MEKFDTVYIEYLLNRLNDKLKSNNENGSLAIYGGTVMCCCYKSRGMTKDIDGIFYPKQDIYRFVKEIAEEEGISSNWLNDSVKGFISEKNDLEIFKRFSNLEIFVPNIKYQLAMKVVALRTEDDSNDIDDIRFLVSRLNLRTAEEIEDICLEYYSERMFKPATHFVLEQIVSDNGMKQ